jgi:secreted trypsin-like serine protease
MLLHLFILLSMACVCYCRKRIVGGYPVDSNDNSFRFIVSMQGKNGWTWQHFCGGSLIHPNWVLTAAHCSAPDRLVFNTYDLKQQNQTIRPFTYNLTRHTGYIGKPNSNFNNDIALIKLNIPITDVKPVVLNNCPNAEKVGQNLTVAGWGKLNETANQMPTILNKVTVPIFRQDICETTYDSVGSNQICAGYLGGGKDSCPGDSGGPLVYQNGNETTLFGIVSYGTGCARQGYPGVYTRVSKYIKWIKGIMKNDKLNLYACPKPTKKPTTRKPTRKPTTN